MNLNDRPVTTWRRPMPSKHDIRVNSDNTEVSGKIIKLKTNL